MVGTASMLCEERERRVCTHFSPSPHHIPTSPSLVIHIVLQCESQVPYSVAVPPWAVSQLGGERMWQVFSALPC